jgi:hypothetical protein
VGSVESLPTKHANDIVDGGRDDGCPDGGSEQPIAVLIRLHQQREHRKNNGQLYPARARPKSQHGHLWWQILALARPTIPVLSFDQTDDPLTERRHEFYRAAQQGDLLPLAMLLHHEFCHSRNGGDERAAMAASAAFLERHQPRGLVEHPSG